MSTPNPPRPNIIAIVNNGEIIASGSAVMAASHTLTFKIANLSYQIKFEKDYSTESQNVKYENNDGSSMDIILVNFNNVLGTTLNPTQIGQISGKPIYIGLMAEAISEEVRVMSYTIYWGGDFG